MLNASIAILVDSFIPRTSALSLERVDVSRGLASHRLWSYLVNLLTRSDYRGISFLNQRSAQAIDYVARRRCNRAQVEHWECCVLVLGNSGFRSRFYKEDSCE